MKNHSFESQPGSCQMLKKRISGTQNIGMLGVSPHLSVIHTWSVVISTRFFFSSSFLIFFRSKRDDLFFSLFVRPYVIGKCYRASLLLFFFTLHDLVFVFHLNAAVIIISNNFFRVKYHRSSVSCSFVRSFLCFWIETITRWSHKYRKKKSFRCICQLRGCRRNGWRWRKWKIFRGERDGLEGEENGPTKWMRITCRRW